MSRPPVLLWASLLAGALACGSTRPQSVSSDQISAEFLADAEEVLGFDPRTLPDPVFPSRLLADPKTGAHLQEFLELLAHWRSALTLDLVATAPAAQGIRLLGEECTPLSEVCDSSVAGVRRCERDTHCGELRVTWVTVAMINGSSLETTWDGTASDGTVYDGFVPARVQLTTEEGKAVIISSGDQRPADPGPWWDSTFSFDRLTGGVSVSKWTVGTYVFDSQYGGYHPWSRTIFTTHPSGDIEIMLFVWDPNQQKLYLWLVDTITGGDCSRIERDVDGVIVDQKAC